MGGRLGNGVLGVGTAYTKVEVGKGERDTDRDRQRETEDTGVGKSSTEKLGSGGALRGSRFSVKGGFLCCM